MKNYLGTEDFLASKFHKIEYYINIYHLNLGETEIKNYGYTYGLIINSVLFLYLIFYIKINFELKYVLLSSLFLSFLLNNFGFLVERIYLFGNYTVLYMISIYVFNKKYKYNFYSKKLFFLLLTHCLYYPFWVVRK